MKTSKYCSVFGCLNTNKDRSLSFFSLPKDIKRRQKWLKLVGREDLLKKEDLNLKSNIVCSVHFEESSIKTIKNLKVNAVPTILLPNQWQDGSSSETQNKDKEIRLSNKVIEARKYKKYLTVGTQTKLLQSVEEATHSLDSLIDGTTRKRKLSNELGQCKLKLQRLDKEIVKMKKELEAKNDSITCNDPDDEIVRRFRKLIEWQNKIKNKHKGNRYDAEYKMFALNLHYSSPQAYRCLQTVLKLPCKSTLDRFKINIPPKFDNRVLDSLALKLKSLPDSAKQCTICVDEMTLKRHLYYDINTDEVIGFHNVNGKLSPEIASNAFVIMLQGICFKWKQPIAYALLATAKHYEEIELWMKEVIAKLSAIGIKVKAIVSKQGSNFDKFVKEVKKVTVEKPYFMYDNTKIYYILDVPHLTNSIRDNLLTNDFLHDGKKYSWDYIEELYKDQKERKLKLIPNITDAHIQPNTYQKINVKLAAQILSRTVSAALHTYIDLGKMSEEARPTAEFIELMNNLFDVLNSSKIKCCNKFQKAYGLSEDQEDVLNDAKEMFAAIKVINRKTGTDNTEHIKSLVNFQISIQSIKMLYEDLKENDFKYLLTRRLNQDNLVNFFDSIRQQSGSCSVPTPIQFRRAFSKLFLCNMIKRSPNANGEMDMCVMCDALLKAEDMMNITLFSADLPSTPPLPTSEVYLRGETDYRMDLPDENALIYASGYLFFKCINEHKCPDINEVLKSVPGLGETNLFTRYADYNKKSGFYGRLKMPPNEFIQYVQNLETAFTQNLDKLIQNNPGGKLLELFKTVPPQTPCSCFPVDYLLTLFARFRIFATIKFNNRRFKDDKKGLIEYVKVSHL